jgi:hypothetical protein
VLGRHFLDSEDAAGGPPVVLIGHQLWTRRFGRDPGIVGRILDFDGRRHEVVGVLPADFGLLLPPEAFWLRMRRSGGRPRSTTPGFPLATGRPTRCSPAFGPASASRRRKRR